MNDGPLIVQSDKTLLLEVDHEQADAARKAIAPFAELERSPEHIHTYRLTPLGLEGAIVGKALYNGNFTLQEALAVAGDEDKRQPSKARS